MFWVYMDEIKENQYTRTLCEKFIFSCNLFHPADWLAFDTLNSEFFVKFQNKLPGFQKKCVSVILHGELIAVLMFFWPCIIV
jgi:hypothetical protein